MVGKDHLEVSPQIVLAVARVQLRAQVADMVPANTLPTSTTRVIKVTPVHSRGSSRTIVITDELERNHLRFPTIDLTRLIPSSRHSTSSNDRFHIDQRA
jgi:hypothetical protein